ncbi:MAG: sulfatase-like hydrolase/transferase [Pseudomonadales bacterium]|nr:sulfatase-like hydrolase/transferase [Pseudomonadales bacterium]
MTATPKYFHPILHMFAFCSIAIAQPILDIIGRNPEFLIAQQTDASEILFVLLSLSLIIPFALSIPFIVSNFINKKFAKTVFSLTLGFLAAILALTLVKRFLTAPDIVLLLVAGILAGVFLYFYWQREAVRMFCSYISLAIVLVPLLFIINGNVLRTVFIAAEPTEIQSSNVDTPVVMVVFDELPLISLLDENLDIDAERYPNFARLKNDSHWFRNTHTVSSVTTLATPALLSGTLRTNALPVAADHPQNLFSLLSASHELHAWEIVTRLCASSKCNEQTSSANETEVRGLLSDLSIVYLHLVSPPAFSQRLPVISQSWSNFGNTTADLLPLSFNEFAVTDRANSRVAEFHDFVQAIEATNEPALYFHHALLPHMPWELLPSGKQYSALGSRVLGLDAISDHWGSNTFLVNQAYQRHLLQTVYVDSLLGELLDRLEEQQIYDDALLVVTSDHGATFQTNNSRRDNTGEINKYQVELVPLFIKLPHQLSGEEHQQAVSTVDVFPTIAGALNIPLYSNTQGIDLFGDGQRSSIPQLMEGELTSDAASLVEKITLFGTGDVESIYQIGQENAFRGVGTTDLNASIASGISFQLDQQDYLQNLNTESLFIPSWLTGEFVGENLQEQNSRLLFALNGEVVAAAESFTIEEKLRFSVFLPEESFAQGFNALEIYRVQNPNGAAPRVEQILSVADRVFRYSTLQDRSSTQILEQNGRSLQLSNNLVRGEVDLFRQPNGLVSLNMWAITADLSQPLEYLLLDVAGELSFLGAAKIERPDIVSLTGNANTLLSGWQYTIPGSEQNESSSIALRLIGVSSDSFEVLKSLNFIGSKSDEFQFNDGTIVSRDGGEIRIETSPIGSIDLARIRNNIVDLEGWSSDFGGSRQPDFYLLDNGGELYLLGESNVSRPDLVEVFAEDGLENAGFAFRIPVAVLEEQVHPSVRLLAITGNQAFPVGTTSPLANRLTTQ